MSHDDFATEPVRGLPETPPEGERILWQGAPSWRALAWRAFGVRWVALYFALICAWQILDMGTAGAEAAAIGKSLLVIGIVGVVAAGVLALLAWVTAKTTVYTITTRRVVMRIGVALTVTINLPFRWIGSAALKAHGDGSGDIALTTMGETRLAYLMLWPHARPWHIRQPEPTLRGVADAQPVAEILARALREETGQTAPTTAPETDARPAPGGLVAAE